MKQLLFLLFFLCPFIASAQDVIVKKDGSTIVSKVIEITSTDIKYKKYTNLNGPTYSLTKAEIQAINYENGDKETFNVTNDMSKPTVQGQHGMSDYALLQLAGGGELTPEQKTQKMQLRAMRLKKSGWIVGSVVTAGGVALLVSGIILGYEDYYPCFYIGSAGIVGGPVIATACLIRAHNIETRTKYSVYNTPLYKKEFSFNNGTTLATGIDLLKDSRLNSQTLGIGLRYNF